MKFKHSDLRLRVNGRLFDAITMTQAKDDVRYYLNGVYVEPAEAGGVLVVATDGHRLSAVRDPNGYCAKPCILQTNKPLLQAARRKAYNEVVMVNKQLMVAAGMQGVTAAGQPDEDIEIVADYIYPDVPTIDGKYPDFRHVIPKADDLEPGLHPAVNFTYLAGFAQQASRIGYPYRCVLFYSHKVNPKNRSVVIRFGDLPDYLGLLMPMRDDYGFSRPLPAWADDEQQDEKAAA